MGGFDVFYPIRSRAEHRYQITFAFDGGDNHGCRALMAGCPATDFQDGHLPRRKAEGRPPTRQSVDPAADARWPPVTVEQAQQGAAFRRIGILGVAHGFVFLPFCSSQPNARHQRLREAPSSSCRCYPAPDPSGDPLSTSTILPATPPLASNSCACLASARGNRCAMSGLIFFC